MKIEALIIVPAQIIMTALFPPGKLSYQKPIQEIFWPSSLTFFKKGALFIAVAETMINAKTEQPPSDLHVTLLNSDFFLLDRSNPFIYQNSNNVSFLIYFYLNYY
jgi:hypothetical protein